MFEIGDTMTWHRISDDRRRVDEVRGKILKIARNGVFIELMLTAWRRRTASSGGCEWREIACCQ
jgi:hypothetical protein